MCLAAGLSVAPQPVSSAGPLEDATTLERWGQPENARIVRTLHQAATDGDYGAAYDLAVLYVTCRIWVHYPYQCPDFEGAEQILADVAEAGFAPAQALLAEIYLFGDVGAPVAPEVALELLRAAANQENAAAQFLLGRVYSDGLGVEPDSAAATMWSLRAAANQGNGAAQLERGRLLAGAGNDAEALLWIKLAVAAGVAEASSLLEAVESRMTEDLIAGTSARAADWRPQACGPWPHPPCL